jgi:hypothetical protein
MEAGDKVGTKTGYEYLAPSPPLDKVVSPNITHHAFKVFNRGGWEPRLITIACNGLERKAHAEALAN